MNIGSITGRLRKLLVAEEPFVLNYKMTHDGYKSKTYDLIVDVEYPFSLEIMPFLS